jgi:hypothetical protein
VENGTKIDILLKEKPNTNVFNLTLTGWENFSFFYQPPLNEDQGALSNDFVQSCSETECVDSEGNVVITRNEDIVDSYAVYHKFKKHHIVGQTDYKTGKAFHIYRPKIIDSKGSEVWAELSYNEGVLSVTVPQDFLDNANYPVRIDPTFGNTNVGGTEQAGLALDDIYGLVATTSDSATVDSITAYTALGGDRSFKGVMSTNVTAPLILTNGVGTGIIQNDDNWTTSTMSTPPSITAGTSYLIGWIADAQGGMWYDVGASGVSYRDTSNSYATPQDWGTRGARTEIWSIYATYTISSGGTFNNPQLNVGGEIFIHGDINIAN